MASSNHSAFRSGFFAIARLLGGLGLPMRNPGDGTEPQLKQAAHPFTAEVIFILPYPPIPTAVKLLVVN